MKYLGIDYGDKRIGIAISDSGGKIAFPKKVLFNRPNLMAQLKSLMEEEEISRVVIGLPTAAGGKATEQTEKVKKFAQVLRNTVSISVEFEDELLTTHLVEQAGIKKENVDEAAAGLILQTFLDKLHK